VSTADRPSHRAVVIGASMSGLLAARVLADHFTEVEVLDRDPLPAEPAHRKGVPQGRHAHGLLAAGGRALEQLFPGLMRELVARGATEGDAAQDLRWFQFGVYKARFHSGIEGTFLSRPLLESAVRARVAALPNVTVRQGVDVRGLAHRDGRVIGVECGDAGGGTTLRPAVLVVDASGRGSRTPAWLTAMGYDAPQEETVPVDVTYTTRVLERRPGEMDGSLGMIVPPRAPAETRGAALLAMEGDRWILTLIGMVGDRAPADDAGFLAYARSLGAPEIGALVASARPLSEFVTYRFAANVRRRYERLRRFPRGLVVIGDALASFNPIYGQGMTVASREALALDAALREGAYDAVAPRFFRRAARVIDNPWTLTVGEDLRYPQVPGPRPLPVRLLHRYIGALHYASATDAAVCRAFHRVANMLAAPPSLLHPAIASRVALAALRRRLGERRPYVAAVAPTRG
jgi:2-polyprenyl-6-methoxyphenol hydroxylase-like FAD-dependent oxidoreductase